MDELKIKIERIIGFMGFRGAEVSVEENLRRMSVSIPDGQLDKDQIGDLVLNLNALLRVMAKKAGLSDESPIVFDVNNYRRERDNLIIDLAKAAARKAVATKVAVSLPPMNAYERRLVHAELGMRPDVKTESVGEGKSRYVIIKVEE